MSPIRRRSRSFAQSLMESSWVARAYESRLLRRSRVINLLQRISFEDEYDLVVGSLNLDENALVVDVACGTGIYARSIARARPSVKVTGIDISVPMLSQAMRCRDRERLTNVHYLQADSNTLPLAGGVADAAVCCGALHLFRDPERVLGEIRRVLKPGGRLAIATFRRRPGSLSEKATALRKRVTGMAAYLPDELASSLGRAGFSGVEHLHAKGIWLISSATNTSAP